MSEPDETERDPRDSSATEVTKREGPEWRARSSVPDADDASGVGTTVGRYVVLGRLGAGGMGIVFAAFDPELDRKVAIKVLQGKPIAGASGGDQAWLLREAQALARLQHPNVVAVHDVGTLPGEQVFVAMELVDGLTMRAWLKAEARPWRDVLPVMRAAGSGLAAAHRAGLVHRDFKPENVLVGNDGRVRVTDFGLARLGRSPDATIPPRASSEASLDAQRALSAELTFAGHVVGTPAYIAPEIYAGEPGDARSDQFAFGVTLFEALFHARPFDRKQLKAAAAAPPTPNVPADSRVPAGLQRVALRAISIDPAQRFASMDELLAELARDPLVWRRRALIGVASAAVLAGAVVATRTVSASHPQPCRGIDQRLAGVWDPATKQTVRDAYVATKLVFAPQAYAELEHALDGYAAAWTASAVGSCEATRVRGDQTEEVLTLREECLDQRLGELAALTHALATPTTAVVEKGGKVARELESLARCGNVAALRDQKRPPPELAPQVRDLDKQLADAKAQLIVGNYIAAGAAATAASRVAAQIDDLAIQASADLIRGVTLSGAKSFDEATRVLESATLGGIASGRNDLVAHGAFTLAMITAEGLGQTSEARIWLAIGKAAAKRNGVDLSLELRQYEIEGIVGALTGDLPGAIAAHERGLVAAVRYFGADNPMLWEDEEVLGATIARAYDFGKAARHFERALELRKRTVGPDHVELALILSNLGACYTHLRDPRARPTLERAVAIREKAYGATSPVLVPTLQNLAENRRFEGDLAAALSAGERALRLSAVIPGKEHPMYQDAANDYALTLTAAGRYRDARAVLDEVLALEGTTKSALRPDTEVARAELALAERAWPDAVTFANRAVADLEAAGGKDNPALWRALGALGRAELELGKTDDARSRLERAVAIAEKVQVAELELAPTREALARLTTHR